MISPPAVFIRCDGGSVFGLGHVSRCLTLADAFSRRGFSPRFITHAPDGVAAAIIRGRGHPCLLSPAIAGEEADLVFTLELLSGQRGDNLLILDSKRLTADQVSRLGQRARTVALDDEERRDLPVDVLINNHAWISPEDYATHPAPTRLLGPRFNLVPPAFFALRERSESYPQPLGILVTLGGEDPHNHTAWIAENLGDLLAPHRVKVILGPFHPAPEQAAASVRRHLPAATIVHAPTSLLDHFRDIDWAFTAGGITCYELAAAAIPQIGIAVEAHQTGMIRAFVQAGAMHPLGSFDHLPRGKARREVATLFTSPGRHATMRNHCKIMFASSGAEQIVEVLYPLDSGPPPEGFTPHEN